MDRIFATTGAAANPYESSDKQKPTTISLSLENFVGNANADSFAFLFLFS